MNNTVTYSQLLEQKLLDIGLTKAQAQSKSVAAVLAILANDDKAIDIYGELNNAIHKCNEMEKELWKTKQEYQSARYRCERAEQEYRRKKAEFENIKDIQEQIYTFDTPEMRDRYRLAQFYKENAYQENVYQKTEFNKGLALILSKNAEESEE